jgi:hypothetical protein
MKFLKTLFRDRSNAKHVKNLIEVQKEIIKVHESTLFLLKSNYTDRHLKSLIEDDLKEAKQVLESYNEDLKKLES